MTTNDLSASTEQPAATQERVPTKTGALVGGALVVLSGVIAIALFHARLGGAFGQMPGLVTRCDDEVLGTISTYVVSAAWITVGVLMMTKARQQMALVAALGTLVATLFIVVPAVELHAQLIQSHWYYPFYPELFLESAAIPVLTTLAFGVCIALRGSRSPATKIVSIVAMVLAVLMKFVGAANFVATSLANGDDIASVLLTSCALLAVPLLAMIGWIVVIASVKAVARSAEAGPLLEARSAEAVPAD